MPSTAASFERHDRSAWTTPAQWPWALASAPRASSQATRWSGALLRRWSGTSPVMEQPPLDHHYIVMHLGGAKRVTRSHDGAPVTAIVESGSLTVVPAGTAFTWRTQGPIAFAHLYLHPRQLADTVSLEFDLDARCASLAERVGWRDPMQEALFARMIDEIEAAANASSLLLDCLLESFLIRLVREQRMRAIAAARGPMALAPHRLRRVLEFLEANLHLDVGLDDMVRAAGTSQHHFSHAFRAATGFPPYRYLIDRRVEQAKVLLMTSDESLEAVSSRCGFNSQHQFAVMFKRSVGMGPKRFRLNFSSVRSVRTTATRAKTIRAARDAASPRPT